MSATVEFEDIHWLLNMVQNIDAGIVVIDLEMNVQVWNGFMENHSGLLSSDAVNHKLNTLFTDIPEQWLQQKLDTIRVLKNKAFTTWEQRPYLFKFKSYRPFTSSARFMYQNVTFLPLTNLANQVTQVCMIIYDVTDVALNKQMAQEANLKLEHLSHTDTLTKLNNQGYWRECCETEYKRHSRTQSPSSLIMLDIDHFKNINDTYGHPFGDEVIKGVADCIRSNMRDTDIAGRYGGEEFTLVLVATDLDGAKLVAERIREDISALVFDYQGKDVSITASFGISQITSSIADYKAWIKTADLGLYIAKDGGRNRVCVSPH